MLRTLTDMGNIQYFYSPPSTELSTAMLFTRTVDKYSNQVLIDASFRGLSWIALVQSTWMWMWNDEERKDVVFRQKIA